MKNPSLILPLTLATLLACNNAGDKLPVEANSIKQGNMPNEDSIQHWIRACVE